MSSPFFLDTASPPLPISPVIKPSAQSHTSLEAFPDFPTSPSLRPSKSSHRHTNSSSHLEVPGQQQRPTRPFRSASQRLPPTALLPASRDASHVDLTTPTVDNRDRDDHPQQRLPRAMPAPSLTGPSIRLNSGVAPELLRGSTANASHQQQQNAEELKSESLWADMQRTLADVELSAMTSSHLFNPKHSQALEKLRETQLALAQAWARSEADETLGQESEDDYLDSEPEGGIQAGSLAPHRGGPEASNQAKGGKAKGAKEAIPKPSDRRARQGSTGSSIGRDLEEETERDIKLARKRREANDQYFSQVNHGVVDVVARLDEVAAAMRTVEKESRAVWEEMDGGGSTTASATDLGDETDDEERRAAESTKHTTRGTSITWKGSQPGDSPVSPRAGRDDAAKENMKAKDKGKLAGKEKVTGEEKEKGR